jgi:hypothetical protein
MGKGKRIRSLLRVVYGASAVGGKGGGGREQRKWLMGLQNFETAHVVAAEHRQGDLHKKAAGGDGAASLTAEL